MKTYCNPRHHDKEAGCLWYPRWLMTSHDHILRKAVLEYTSSTSYWKWLCDGQSQPWNRTDSFSYSINHSQPLDCSPQRTIGVQTLCLLDIQQVVLDTIHYFDLVIIDYNHLYNITTHSIQYYTDTHWSLNKEKTLGNTLKHSVSQVYYTVTNRGLGWGGQEQLKNR